VVPGAAAPGLPPEVDEMPPDPDEPAVGFVPPGTMAGEPVAVDRLPEATGRSADGRDSGDVDSGVVVDCARAGVASAAAARQAAICFFSMRISDGWSCALGVRDQRTSDFIRSCT
jgi:hypothetical protein